MFGDKYIYVTMKLSLLSELCTKLISSSSSNPGLTPELEFFYICGEIYITQSLTILTIVSIHFCGIRYTYIIGRVSTIHLQNFLSSSSETLYPLNNISPFSLPPALETTTLLSVSMNLTTLGSSYEWNHTVFVLS